MALQVVLQIEHLVFQSAKERIFPQSNKHLRCSNCSLLDCCGFVKIRALLLDFPMYL